MSSLTLHPIDEIISEIAAGKMVIVTDDPGRENEADLVAAASMVTPEIIAFMANHGRGLICAPITAQRATELDLPPMTARNTESMKTAFTVSIDAAEGVTTGISAADRARAIHLLANPEAKADAFVQPGHIFPLQAIPGGVLRRAGHTEAAVDLARMAGLPEAGVICEIMNEDGTMARAGDLGEYQQTHQLKACTIADLIEFRRRSEKLVQRGETIDMPTDYGKFDCHLYYVDAEDTTSGGHHLAFTRGEISPDEPTLVRVHSECLTGDVFHSQRCDCGGQLDAAMRQIAEEGGVLLYLRQEGRGIGLPAKIHAYKLQEQGLDTIEANEKLGYGEDLRNYGMGAQILYDLGVRKIKLLTNNPKKMIGLEGYNLEIIEQIPLSLPANPHNQKYLQTKKDRMGHTL
ncbi:bifunctional 3,4-dihydroxy-2-butanone-4-phosphate synthase/GTP cyclohydrolase II [Verrucomicrobiaceae bacterium R5-34]|uniref:Riboflavin biosynthesis protein RibBA n=1 Tax=Oceaniferula flava TaxID=2800421 RepID=A0AAE2VCY7_9BACT|nr:bifunctional 3,4-dihydroxy-2-butanone-4-phosphate synthase/GTP cyclohydrolase II [Oceaniferula flavus]MBK1829684.1 bifunctional 3,4-dihydroxy-2-butanone-4-phosphate synthase/GTP cyclohydrolase II [Verrucomicrobiaceae bacterium R5-34]MBK1853874.1 bifunctional 3,4-dihydroxy-2-butanone-4-phosphate synthase/GTP cyclohydrolase II [Oceaniferula flavus]MBM1135180.1 bifunctional 3,4-dihydroxy-2-butanone-4-phosphate synthase/GTP cyclohydrolase II [Oceaniferula flavus]